MSSTDINDIKNKQKQLYNHIMNIDSKVNANYDDSVQVTNAVGSLYEYTHHGVQEVNNLLQK